MVKKIISIIKIFLIVTILLSSFVYAFKATSLDKQLTVQPGEEKIVELEIEGDANGIVRAEITEGEEIAQLKETEYTLTDTENIKIPVEIKIPEDITEETRYTIKVSFSTSEASKVVGTGYSTSFDVIVSPKLSNVSISQQRTNYLNWMIIASVIIGITVILIILRKKK